MAYSPEETRLVEAAEALMTAHMAQYDPSHDALHCQRVRRTALAIAHSLFPLPDLLVVELAALLHDISDHKYTAVTATTESSLQPILIDFPKERAELVQRIIDNVSWSKEQKRRAAGTWGAWEEECRELWCVQDADRLDAIGAFGIMRCAAYSAVTNRPLHRPDAKDSAIGHFHDKLLKISGSLKTDLGRKMGVKRHQVMLEFLREVEEEANTQ